MRPLNVNVPGHNPEYDDGLTLAATPVTWAGTGVGVGIGVGVGVGVDVCVGADVAVGALVGVFEGSGVDVHGPPSVVVAENGTSCRVASSRIRREYWMVLSASQRGAGGVSCHVPVCPEIAKSRVKLLLA
jgi:hypothetical protein